MNSRPKKTKGDSVWHAAPLLPLLLIAISENIRIDLTYPAGSQAMLLYICRLLRTGHITMSDHTLFHGDL